MNNMPQDINFLFCSGAGERCVCVCLGRGDGMKCGNLS